MGRVLFTEEERLDGAELLGVLDAVAGLCVGVADLNVDLEVEGVEDLAGGVEERAVVLEGVEDLTRGATVLLEGAVPLEIGVDDLEGFDAAGKPDRLVGVGNLEAVDFWPPDDDDLLFPETEVFASADVYSCPGASFGKVDLSGVFSG